MKTAEDIAITKESITMALFRLMKKKPYASITITDIAKESGFGRVTFYRHFKSKEDVLRKYFLMQQVTFVSTIGMPDTLCDFHEIIFRIFSILQEHKEMFQLIQRAGIETLYLDFLNEQLSSYFVVQGFYETVYAPYFFAGSLFNVSMQWIRDDCVEPIERLTETYMKFLFLSLSPEIMDASSGQKSLKREFSLLGIVKAKDPGASSCEHSLADGNPVCKM